MNRHYDRGCEAERRAKNDLEAEGYIVARAAGSHGPFDIVAVNHEEVRLIQVKRSKTGDESYKQELQALSQIRIPICATAELWTWVDRIGWRKTEIKWRHPAQGQPDGG